MDLWTAKSLHFSAKVGT